ncbi:MAG: hypothetical protein GC154_13430 [bacterium]|nr:hypothetical protein [bacterium]
MNFQGIFHLFMRRVSGKTIIDHARTIWENNRWSDFDGLEKTAEFAIQQFEAAGLKAERVELPADGETRFGDAVMPRAWNGRKAVLEVVSPEHREIARRETSYNLLGMWSPPTPPNGMEAELIHLENEDAIHSPDVDVEGKFVLTRGRLEAVRAAAVKKGAAAVISCWSNSPKHPEWTQWLSGNTDRPGAWGLKKDEGRLITLSISPAQGDELFALAKKGPVKMRLLVDAHIQPGTMPLVDACIEGEDGEQEIWIFAPINGPGANYNGAGAALLLEIARLVTAEIDEKTLPKPHRTIRFLLTPKPYGPIAYALRYPERAQRALAAFNLETAAGNPDAAWCRWSLRTSPAPMRHFTDALLRRICRDFLAHWRPQRSLEDRPLSLAGDVYWNDPLIGVTTHWLHGGPEEEVRNNSGDAIETLDERSCVDLGVTGATVAYIFSVLGVPDVPILAQWNFRFALKNIWREVDVWMDRADEAQSGADLHEIWRDARLRLQARRSVEEKALQSLNQIDPAAHNCEEWKVVRELNYTLGDVCDAALAAVGAHLEARAAVLEAEFCAEEPVTRDHEDNRVPIRVIKAPGAVTLDSLPYEEWTSPVKRSPRTNPPFTLSWWLADGNRTIGEIERLVRLEIPQFRECIPAWFNFLEKRGYVRFRKEKDE